MPVTPSLVAAATWNRCSDSLCLGGSIYETPYPGAASRIRTNPTYEEEPAYAVASLQAGGLKDGGYLDDGMAPEYDVASGPTATIKVPYPRRVTGSRLLSAVEPLFIAFGTVWEDPEYAVASAPAIEPSYAFASGDVHLDPDYALAANDPFFNADFEFKLRGPGFAAGMLHCPRDVIITCPQSLCTPLPTPRRSR